MSKDEGEDKSRLKKPWQVFMESELVVSFMTCACCWILFLSADSGGQFAFTHTFVPVLFSFKWKIGVGTLASNYSRISIVQSLY